MPPKTNRVAANTVRPVVRCPNGTIPDEYGNCWNFKIQPTLVRGAPCDPTFERWLMGDPAALRKALLKGLQSMPQYKNAMKRMKSKTKSGNR
jgi:hypothetical protein